MERKGILMYLGMRAGLGHISYSYIEINDDNTEGKPWSFDTKLFTKGSVGAVFNCVFKDEKNVAYNVKQLPTYVLEMQEGNFSGTAHLFAETINKAKVLDRQAQVIKRNSTKKNSELENQISEIREVYKSLTGVKKSRFIADVIYNITK